MRRALTLALWALAFPVGAQPAIVDGDTIRMEGKSIRLWGIDAPELKQWCENYPAGAVAAAALSALVGTSEKVSCAPKTVDRYGRVVAICRVNGEDLGRVMVRTGMALAFTRYSNDYVTEEQEAKFANLGLHAHNCQPPWDWRATHRR